MMNQQFLDYMAAAASQMITSIESLTDPAAIRGAKAILLTLCRNMEDVAPRNVSVKAAARGRELGIDDLRAYHFDAGGRFPGGRKASRLHWEHWRPASDLRSELLSLHDPTPAACKSVLETARVCWVLLEENDELNRRGCRTGRRDPAGDYAAAGIEMQYEW
jgi:hypothetical protein